MKKSTNNLQTGCGCIPYLVMVVMLASPVIMLIRAIASAPTPEHRAIVEAQAPNPVADWVVIGLCVMFLAFTLLVVLLKGDQTVEYDPPAVDLPDALTQAAKNHWITDLPMGEVKPGQAKILHEAIQRGDQRRAWFDQEGQSHD
jgi:hypothetical protein